jgi:hypothetical protein
LNKSQERSSAAPKDNLMPHVVNQMPYGWFCKVQFTVNKTTYGAKFGASRTCVGQIVDTRLLFRYLGVPVIERSRVFGHIESMTKSTIRFDAEIQKRHVILSFHRVREGMAPDKMTLTHIPSHENPADVLSKHWSHNEVWRTPKPLLFWLGDTTECFVSEEDCVARKKSNNSRARQHCL